MSMGLLVYTVINVRFPPLDQIKRYLAFIPNIDFRMRADIAIYVNLVENKNGTSAVKRCEH